MAVAFTPYEPVACAVRTVNAAVPGLAAGAELAGGALLAVGVVLAVMRYASQVY
jgi:hypothetical protein